MTDAKGTGKRIQGLRKAKGLTQEKMAEALDISTNYLSNIERGQDICSMTLLLRIANMLSASMDYLLGDNLEYNKIGHKTGEQHALLFQEIGAMSEKDCVHLLKYIALQKEN